MEHTPERPSWDCRACTKPWPCDPARERLKAEMDGIQLRIFLWTVLEEAVGQFPKTPAAETFDRFLRWAG